ncbi:TPA: hypothetical protein ACH3X3_012952 [Trebouxia sp. C0006]
MQKPIVWGWNKPTVEYYDVTQARVVKAPAGLRFFGICGLVTALIGWQGNPLTGWLPNSLAVSTSTGWLLYILAGVCLTVALRYLTLAALRKPAWEATKTNAQRKLLGIPITAEDAEVPQQHRLTQPTQAAPAPQQLKSPLGAPNRSAQTISSPAFSHTPRTSYYSEANRESRSPYSPFTPTGHGRHSPYKEVVTTSRQCKRYMDCFDMGTSPAALPAEPHYETTFSPYDRGSGMQANATVPLFSGATVPTYHPSLVPRGKAGSPHAPDGGLHPTSPEALEDLLRQLKTDRRTLEVWVERFREWMSKQVLQQLLIAAEKAHKDVQAACAAVSVPVNVIPLSQGVSQVADYHQSAAGDQIAQLAHIKAGFQQRLRPDTPSSDPGLLCVQAIHRYQKLTELLQGEQPRQLLPPTPRGYILARVRALAEGPCMTAFTWNGGSSWNNKPWTNELPTDSTLVFFLFAAFLEFPRWHFPLEESQSHASTGGPLYLGSLPHKPAEQYFAVLPLRPPPDHKGATCMLQLDMSTSQPRFTLMLQADPVLTACSYVGLYHVILLFLQNLHLHHHGQVGGRTLGYLKLSAVLRPSEPSYNLFAGKWFGFF